MKLTLLHSFTLLIVTIAKINSYNVTNNATTLTPSLNKHRINIIKPSLDTLKQKEDLESILSTYADKGLDLLIHGPPGLGKTHSMLCYGYEHTQMIKNVKSTEPFRTIYISSSRELAIQSGEFVSSKWDRQHISLLIGKACKADLISIKKRFIFTTSNFLSEYLLLLDPDDRKEFIQSIKLLLIDEIDTLFKLPGKYNRRKTEIWVKNKTQLYNILQAILAINKNKTQIIAASATLNRSLSRTLDNLIHTFKKYNKCGNMVYIRVGSETDKSASIPENIALYHHICDSYDEQINYISKIVATDTIIFANHSYSLIKIKNSLLNFGIESTLLHESMGINDKRMQTMDRILDTYQTNKFRENGVRIASMDSARGIVTMSTNIILMGRPRKFNEFIHLIGRVVHNKNGGKCTIVGQKQDIDCVVKYGNFISKEVSTDP